MNGEKILLSSFGHEFINSYKGYFEDGFFLLLFILSIVYLIVNLKIEKRAKLICVYLPILILVLTIFNPIYYKISIKAERYVYARTYWIIPIFLILSYAISCVIMSVHKIQQKLIITMLVVLLIAIGGNGIFSKGVYTYKHIQNKYKLPQQVVDVGDIIYENNGEHALILAPEEINMNIRQYLYNTKVLINTWDLCDDIYIKDEYLEQDKGKIKAHINSVNADINYVLGIAKYSNCDFIVLKAGVEINDDLISEYGYFKVGETEKYLVYKK